MTSEAAIFDLDRTLLRGASGPIISDALRDVGLLPERNIPGQGLVFRLFDVVGETRPSMLLTRQLARMASGWDRDRAIEAGHRAAVALERQVQPYAREAIEHHREAGRQLVMATTTPLDLIQPFADSLGIANVLATKYGIADGKYDGTFDGEFVWGKGKLRAVRDWADRAGVDLSQSYAYSDSYYDAPLLRAVGHPAAVNPDPRLRVLAVLMRWPTVYFDVPPGVPKFAGVEPQQVMMALARPEMFPYVRFDVDGLEHVPTDGPAIIAGNHRSYFDPLAVGFALSKAHRPVRFLGKKEVFDAPVVGDVARAMGGIRVERGSGSDEPLREAAEALHAGELVAIMPQGTIPRGHAFFDPELKGRWGAARLAALADVPVVPLGLWGTEQVWPRNSRVPNVLNVTSPPTVRVRLGPPVPLGHLDPEADTQAVMGAIVDLLPPAARVRHEPTADELAVTLPAGHGDDGLDEADRRPGSD
jgi:putative phosphoserine phosphatase/1-acylglycerol-3-phosphate O-acyltransferase